MLDEQSYEAAFIFLLITVAILTAKGICQLTVLCSSMFKIIVPMAYYFPKVLKCEDKH